YAAFFFSTRRRHTRFSRHWSSDVCSSDLPSATLSEPVRVRSTAARTMYWRPNSIVSSSLPQMSRIEVDSEVPRELAGPEIVPLSLAVPLSSSTSTSPTVLEPPTEVPVDPPQDTP